MTDERSAVVTTFNGDIVAWKVFENPSHAMDHYSKEIGRLRDFLQQHASDDAWEILLCDVRQYALSKPRGGRQHDERGASRGGRSRRTMSDRARRIRDLRPQWSRHLWNHSGKQDRERVIEEPMRVP